MRIVNMAGGLGNQMFQYAFALMLKAHYPDEEVMIDTQHYHTLFFKHFGSVNLHNGFEIEAVFPHATLPVARPKDLMKVTYYIPNYRYQGILKKPALSIADGTGVLLSQWQMLNFYGSIANNGVNPRRNHGMKKRIVSEKTAKAIQTLLRDNVLDGTGVLVKDCVIPVAGKTGNGLVDKGRIPGYGLLEERGAIRSSTFVGYFPADVPKYTMCVTYYYKDVFSYTLSSLTFKEIVNRLNQEGLL